MVIAILGVLATIASVAFVLVLLVLWYLAAKQNGFGVGGHWEYDADGNPSKCDES